MDVFKVELKALGSNGFAAEVTIPRDLAGMDNIIGCPFRETAEAAVEDAIEEIRRALLRGVRRRTSS